MNLHEYQAKEIFKQLGVSVPRGIVASTPAEARDAFTQLGAKVAVVKAQVHAGGRGKAGGIKVVKTAEEAAAAAEGMLNKKLITYQTGPEGKLVKKVLVEEGLDREKELYAGIVLDRRLEMPVLIASPEGGMEIEKVAAEKPDAIFNEPFNPYTGLFGFQARNLAYKCGLGGTPAFKPFCEILSALAKVYVEYDCQLIEINPVLVTKNNRVVALDAKMVIDDRFQQVKPEVGKLVDPEEEDPLEMAAVRAGLNYVALDGNIGCMVNGAGLAMTTMDIIKLYGGKPANFLDVGGGASKEMVLTAMKILLSNSRVKAILINIFGGILKCDLVATAIVEAAKEIRMSVPVVVRLEGTNVDAARKILNGSGLNLTTASDMADAAKKVVAAAG